MRKGIIIAWLAILLTGISALFWYNEWQYRLQYRGNYNRSRYCTDNKTEHARLSLDALLKNNNIVFDQAALKSIWLPIIKM
jgi:hypothetical protein